MEEDMREIKFRALDGKLMWRVHTMDVFSGSPRGLTVSRNNNEYGPATETLLSTEAFMQYTGLKDKNGVEIYEGDLIRYKGYTQTVSFRRGCFVCDSNALQVPLRLGGLSNLHMSVIGNIYENPELLEDKTL